MSNPVYELTLAGQTIRYAFRRAKTKYCFIPLPRKSASSDWDIFLTADELEKSKPLYPPTYTEEYVEFRTLRNPTSRFLMDHDACLIHATAFLYRGGAWILPAPSGTGKTTQYLNWQRLYPGEIEMICGDMPVLQRRGDTVWVHPSPWNGKENIGGTVSAPLAGVVLLEQGKVNRFFRPSTMEAINTALVQLVGHPDTEAQCLALSALLDAALSKAQLWHYVNLGDNASTKLLREVIQKGGN